LRGAADDVTYETLRYIHIIFAALAALMLLVSAVIFIAFDIPHAIGSVTGRALKRGVNEIRTRSVQREIKQVGRAETPPRRAEGGAVTTTLAIPEKRRGGTTREDARSSVEAEFEVEYDITYIHTDEVIKTRHKKGTKKGGTGI
jgi:hypothetical protein